MGLRERKKEQTRRAIEDAAFRLFEERGYQATTVADIAEAADIAPRTFFSYFPSKEAVVFGDFEETFATLDARLRERPGDENTFESLRAWIGDLIDSDRHVDERDAVRRRLVCDNESLASHERHVMGRFERLIAENVAIDLGDDPDDLQPRLVAAAAIAALMAMSQKDGEGEHKAVDEEGLAQLDDAFAFLRGGIAALQERRASFG
ncbi:MAG TPA: TetR family transcriptional regulator [Baekduia sp.]|nr:TetR family transcriptional regulator [Baekduia sp.]